MYDKGIGEVGEKYVGGKIKDVRGGGLEDIKWEV